MRRGFALLAVLWTVAVVGTAVAAGTAALRTAERASANRVLLARGRWAAEACLAVARARWRRPGAKPSTETIELGRTTRCVWRLEDAGRKLNVNLATSESLRRLFAARGAPPESCSNWAERLVADRRARPFGSAEEALARTAVPADAEPLLTAMGHGRISTEAAPTVLATLAGLTAEAIRVLAASPRLGSLDALRERLSPASRSNLDEHYAELAGALVFSPAEYILTVEGWVEGDRVAPHAIIELLAAPQPDRLSILQRRMQ
jgi:hypothetical protein